MARSQIWDGTQWISMTGGAGEEGGGDPDDTHLRLDGSNNNASPNNFLRPVDADILYLQLSGGTLTGNFTLNALLRINSTGDKDGLLIKAGGSVGSGGGIRLGANQGNHFAGISVWLTDGASNTIGYLDFATRRSTGAADLTLALRIGIDGRVEPRNGLKIVEYHSANIFEYQARNSIITDSFQGGSGAPSNASGQDGDVFFYYGA